MRAEQDCHAELMLVLASPRSTMLLRSPTQHAAHALPRGQASHSSRVLCTSGSGSGTSSSMFHHLSGDSCAAQRRQRAAPRAASRPQQATGLHEKQAGT